MSFCVPEPLPLRDDQLRIAHMRAIGLDSMTGLPEASPAMQRLALAVNAEYAMVSLTWSTENVLFAGVGLPLGPVDRASGICAHAMVNPTEPMVIPDTRYDPRTMDSPFVLGPPFVCSYLGQAFGFEPGLPIGVVFAASITPRAFSQRDIAAVKLAAKEVLSLLRHGHPRAHLQ
jgi:GAF domain-containing protein